MLIVVTIPAIFPVLECLVKMGATSSLTGINSFGGHKQMVDVAK
jgi:hypothetical protein